MANEKNLVRLPGERCPTCESPDPKLHPAMQWEGEVQPCRGEWHSPIAEHTRRQPDPTWALAEEVWAAVEPLTAREYFQAGVVDPRITHRVRMRHTKNMKHDSRIVLGTRTFHPLQPPVNVDERGAELTMNCEERIV